MIPNVLTIAGSDPGGGAGIQADLKTFSALRAYGMAVMTALTAQNTRTVSGVHRVPADFVGQQLDTLFDDIRVDALKIGMIATADIARAIALRLSQPGRPPVVLDPVMVAKSGDRLLDPEAIGTVRDTLLPLATVVTPNLPEAAVLLDRAEPEGPEEMDAMARALAALGPRYVLLKGGHLTGGDSPDLFYDGSRAIWLPAVRIATRNTHGTGCTLSAAIAALIPQRPDIAAAVADAKAYVTAAIGASGQLTVGSGQGPVHHFHALWAPDEAREAV